jgi:hypothetical protein
VEPRVVVIPALLALLTVGALQRRFPPAFFRNPLTHRRTKGASLDANDLAGGRSVRRTRLRIARAGVLPAVLFGAVWLSGCLSAAPAPSAGTPPPSSSQDASGFVTDCQPIDLRGPDGQRVDLTGAWTTADRRGGFFFGAAETTWILQVGDCVWGEIIDDDFLANPSGLGGLGTGGGALGTLRGQLASDRTVEGELITVAGRPGAPGPRAEIRLLIEWPDGPIRLREDRDPNVPGPRCTFQASGTVRCSPPVILYRIEDLSAAPSPQ